MDVESVDRNYAQLQQEAQQTSQLIQALGAKLQTASTSGDPHAREWLLDLKEIALGVQQEQGQTSLLLQSIHAMVDNHVQTGVGPTQQPQYQQPQYQPAQYQQPQYQPASSTGGGGMLQRFLGGGMGRAIMTGAGFGIGDDLINQIF